MPLVATGGPGRLELDLLQQLRLPGELGLAGREPVEVEDVIRQGNGPGSL